MDPLQIRFANEVLHTLVTAHKARLANSIQRRNTVMEAINRGEEPSGYRVDFLRASAKRILVELAEIAREFNAEYPDDRCTAQDFIDILGTTTLWIKKKSTT